MAIEIRQHAPGKDIKDFLRAGQEVFRFDPAWVPPLDMEIGERLSPKHNPFFKRGEAMLFTAHKDGQVVGRISASIDKEHQRLWKDERGFFGLSEPGRVKVLDDGFTRFIPVKNGKGSQRDRFLTMSSVQQSRALEAIVHLTIQPPPAK